MELLQLNGFSGTLDHVVDLTDSLERARREYDAALLRGDQRGAAVIARAIQVLEDAARGEIPRQRLPGES